MTPTIVPRDLVARELAVSTTVLIRYKALGLVHAVREGPVKDRARTDSPHLEDREFSP